jgi:hypothetical protein
MNEQADSRSRKKTETAHRTSLTRPRLVPVTMRQLTPEDFQFVRCLAASIASYTTCPPYVLWMLSRAHPDLCTVALAPDGERLGYLLAMCMDEPPGAVFVWQLAVSFRGRRLKAQDRLAAHLKKSLKKRRKAHIFFTTVPKSAAERSIRSLAQRVFSATPWMTENLPDSVSPKERLYGLALVPRRTKRQPA